MRFKITCSDDAAYSHVLGVLRAERARIKVKLPTYRVLSVENPKPELLQMLSKMHVQIREEHRFEPDFPPATPL